MRVKIDEIPKTAEEIIRIIEGNDIEYISYSSTTFMDETFYHIRFKKNKAERVIFELGDDKDWELPITKNVIDEVFRTYGIEKPMTTGYYCIVVDPTPVYYSQITGEVIQIGDE